MKTKKISWIAILSFLYLFGTGDVIIAQESPRNAIKFKPFSFEFAYERALNNTVSLQLAGRFFPLGISADDGNESGSFEYNNYRIVPEARFYLAKNEVMSGFFIAPHLKAGITTMKAEAHSASDLTEKVKFTGTSLGAGITLGWQWIMGKGFTIDTQFGWGYTRLDFKDVKVTYSDGRTETEQAPLDNVSLKLPRIGFSIGYAF